MPLMRPTPFVRLRHLRPALALAACLVGVVPWAYAEKADRDKPILIEADNLRHDDARQVSVFTGNVALTKGSLILRAARIEARKTTENHQFVVATAAPGQRVYYRQKRDGVDEAIEGEAETIEYDSKAEQVRLSQRAVMRRYIGARLSDEASGNLIVYDNATDSYRIDGGPSNSVGSSGRVRVMLSPRAASAPAVVPLPGAGNPLRSTRALSGEQQQ